jgi:hypothetical protein
MTELRAVMTHSALDNAARRTTVSPKATCPLGGGAGSPDGDRSIAAAFERQYGVSLRFFPPGLGPRDSSVFEVCPPPTGCEHGDILVSVQIIPPSQGDAKLAALERSAWLARGVLGIMLILLLVAAPQGLARWAVALVGVWTLVWGPIGRPVCFPHHVLPTDRRGQHVQPAHSFSRRSSCSRRGGCGVAGCRARYGLAALRR